jgi:hypothetical protein
MERVDLIVADFRFDDDNASHISRHDVHEHDLREVLANAPQYFVNPPSPDRTASHLMLGPNKDGRFILAAISEVEPNIWRPVTAHWFHTRLARRFYEEET